jgi:endonuclease/exonuclease/phosphatase family metal-dependent hydrolase
MLLLKRGVEKERKSFMIFLEEHVKEHQNMTLILLGDFNARIGKEGFKNGIAGRYSLHEEASENGSMLGQLSSMYNMTIKSTCFDHKNVHKGTWKAPGGAINQIDHILISTRYATNITHVRTCRGPNCDTDHYLVKAVLRQRLSNVLKD